jgi:hypothetical protein
MTNPDSGWEDHSKRCREEDEDEAIDVVGDDQV